MNNSFGIILFLFGILMVFILFIFLSKSFFDRIIEPKLSLTDILDFANSNNSIYIEHKKISEKEFELNNKLEKKPNIYKIIFLRKSYFKLITYSKVEKQFELNWIKITKRIGYNFLIEILIDENLKNLLGTKFIKEKNTTLMNQIQTQYETKKILIKDNCPACGSQIDNENMNCEKCGINLSL